MDSNMRILLIICLGVGVFKLYECHQKTHIYAKAPLSVRATRLVGNSFKTEQINVQGKRYLALYHGASWCPPCQAFSPVLAQFYHSAKKDNFELVMVNYDKSLGEMQAYMRQHKMEFPAMSRDEAGAWGKAPSGTGIPNLVIIDTQTDQVVEESYKGGEYQGAEIPLELLRQKTQ